MRKYRKRETRPYNKSELPRLRWTTGLHQHFVQVVEGLGGKYNATPKRIVQMMAIKGLKISHVKSHLQMYRCIKDQTTKEEVTPMKHLRNNADENLPILDIFPMKGEKVSNALGFEHCERNQFEGQSPWKQIPHDNIMSTTTGENLCGKYTQDTHGSTISEVSKEEDNIEGFHSSVNQSTHLNLKLTISTCFSHSSNRTN